MKPRAALGADLVIPLLALAFAVYFFFSIADLAWEAQAHGALIGALLMLLVIIQLARIAMQVARGQGSLRAGALWLPREALLQRIGMVAITVAFIASLEWLGLTLGLLLAMPGALWIMGVRSRRTLVWLPLAIAAAAYVLFIVVLQSEFPHGPIEKLLL